MAVMARDSDLPDHKLCEMSGAEMPTAAFIESNSVRFCDNNNNRYSTTAFDHKVIAVALAPWLV